MYKLFYFKMEEKPVFDLKIKHFFAVHGWDEQFCGAWNSL